MIPSRRQRRCLARRVRATAFLCCVVDGQQRQPGSVCVQIATCMCTHLSMRVVIAEPSNKRAHAYLIMPEFVGRAPGEVAGARMKINVLPIACACRFAWGP
jgi:hypothetical protein